MCRGLAFRDVTVSIERLETTIMYHLGGSRETNMTVVKLLKYLHFNENKTDIHSNATYIYVQPSTTLLIQKINITSALFRVESALHREDVTAIVGFLASKKYGPSMSMIF